MENYRDSAKNMDEGLMDAPTGETYQDLERASFWGKYTSPRRLVGRLGGLAVATLISAASMMPYVHKAEASSYNTLALGNMAYNASVSAPANLGQDDDGDGLSNSYEISIGSDPFNVDSSGDEFYDNVDGGVNFGPNLAYNYHEIISGMTPEADRHHIPLAWNLDGESLYIISTASDLTDPIIYKVERGNPASAVQIASLGASISYDLFSQGASNFTNNGVYVEVDGELREYFDTGTSRAVLSLLPGSVVMGVAVHKYRGDLGNVLFTQVYDSSLGVLDTHIDSFLVGPEGGVNLTSQQIIIDHRINGSISNGITIMPRPNHNGTNIGYTKINPADTRFAAVIHTIDGNLRNVISGAQGPYNRDSTETTRTEDFAEGAQFVSFMGDAVIGIKDSEGVFDYANPLGTILNSDLDARFFAPPGSIEVLTTNHMAKLIGNQFRMIRGPGGQVAYSDFLNGGFANVKLAQLRTRVRLQGNLNESTFTLDDNSYYDPTDSKNSFQLFTDMDTGGLATLILAPVVPLANLNALGAHGVMQHVEFGPIGTIFTGGTHRREAVLNQEILEKYSIDVTDSAQLDATYLDSNGDPIEDVVISDRTQEMVVTDMLHYSQTVIRAHKGPRHVDPAYVGAEYGTVPKPFSSFQTALDKLIGTDEVIKAKALTYNGLSTWDFPVRIESWGPGKVTLAAPSKSASRANEEESQSGFVSRQRD